MAKLKTRFRELLHKKYGEKLPAQAMIAADLEVSQTTVSRWLADRVDRFDSDTLEKICTNMPCELGDLLYVETV